jgi:hypothetical protein
MQDLAGIEGAGMGANAARSGLSNPEPFFTRRSGLNGSNTLFWIGLAMIGIGALALMVASAGGLQVGLGVLLLVTSSWAKNNPLFRLHDDHLEMKLGMLAPRHLIPFGDVTALTRVSQGKTLWLPLGALESHEAERFFDTLQAACKAP